MPFSISPSTPFASIDWNTFESRPRINEPMTFCNEGNWDQTAKCCMDGSSIDYALGKAKEVFSTDTPEIKFLEQYPCVNGPELKGLARKVQDAPIDTTSPQEQPCDAGTTNAFLRMARKFGFGKFADVVRLEKEPTLSCETIMRMAFRYGALALEMGRDPKDRLSSKTFD